MPEYTPDTTAADTQQFCLYYFLGSSWWIHSKHAQMYFMACWGFEHQDPIAANKRFSVESLQEYIQRQAFTKTWTRTETPPSFASPKHVKWVLVACQYQLVPTDGYSLHPLPFVSQQSMDDWWPQLTAFNNCQCGGKPSKEGKTLSIKTQGWARWWFHGVGLGHMLDGPLNPGFSWFEYRNSAIVFMQQCLRYQGQLILVKFLLAIFQ